ncbi:MAG: LacI family DNA-binding transcriptional regulator [Succinivibrio sp.]
MTATIRDVARHAGVSVATVSRVLNGTAKVADSTKEAVLKAQSELGFYLNANARTLARKNSDNIGILVSDISDSYFGVMIKSIEEEAWPLKKNLIITQGFYDAEREKRAIDSLISRQCCALIIHALAISDEELTVYMQKFPYMVLINRILKGFEDRCVNIDNYTGMKMLTEYLISCGHKKFAYVTSSFSIVDETKRLKGFKDALKEHQIEFRDDLLIAVKPSVEGGVEAAKQLLSKKDMYTAVVCYNDVLAASMISVFQNAGLKVPDDISFTGFDDLLIAEITYPSLTTIKNPIANMGVAALKLSLSRFSKENSYTIPKFEISLNVRNSVKHLEK